MIIYKIKNKVNSKIYIGKTKSTLFLRKKGHLKRSKNKDITRVGYFHRAIRKYGTNNFTWQIIDNKALTEKELNEKEKYYIAFFKSNNRNFGYNLTPGGDGNTRTGWKHKEETKKKMQN